MGATQWKKAWHPVCRPVASARLPVLVSPCRQSHNGFTWAACAIPTIRSQTPSSTHDASASASARSWTSSLSSSGAIHPSIHRPRHARDAHATALLPQARPGQPIPAPSASDGSGLAMPMELPKTAWPRACRLPAGAMNGTASDRPDNGPLGQRTCSRDGSQVLQRAKHRNEQ